MIRYNSSSYATGEKVVTTHTIGVGSTFGICRDTVQIMSDVWEYCTFVQYITDDGRVSRIDTSNVEEYTIDITPEAIERYVEVCHARDLADRIEAATLKAQEITKGSTVKVISGKTAKGMTGKVIGFVDSQYGRHYRAPMMKKFGIATSDRTVEVVRNGRTFQNHVDVVWVWACNLAHVETPTLSDEEVTKITAHCEDGKWVWRDYITNMVNKAAKAA